jgi:hypothetical protein
MSRRPRLARGWSRRDWLLFAALATPPAILWIAFIVCVCTGLVEPVL